jgi:hypothetical protein
MRLTPTLYITDTADKSLKPLINVIKPKYISDTES